MVKEGLMKKLLVLSLVFACMTGNAQVPADSVVMTVAGKQIPLDEFIFIAQKNSEVNLSDRKSVNAYVELFKNFKLKVAEAEDLELDKTKAFKDELDSYRAQLTSSYLSDKDGEEAAVRAIYDHQLYAFSLFGYKNLNVSVKPEFNNSVLAKQHPHAPPAS